jgi:hypothetical protein
VLTDASELLVVHRPDFPKWHRRPDGEMVRMPGPDWYAEEIGVGVMRCPLADFVEVQTTSRFYLLPYPGWFVPARVKEVSDAQAASEAELPVLGRQPVRAR